MTSGQGRIPHSLSHYADLSQEFITDGQQVHKGDVIGKSGNSGSGEYHLDAGYDRLGYFPSIRFASGRGGCTGHPAT